ncbi:hypothetical protein amrb99_95100 [Actinomadura sp. RB99]|nr:hypothetical protein [Actinomadura sp. RB99]
MTTANTQVQMTFSGVRYRWTFIHSDAVSCQPSSLLSSLTTFPCDRDVLTALVPDPLSVLSRICEPPAEPITEMPCAFAPLMVLPSSVADEERR